MDWSIVSFEVGLPLRADKSDFYYRISGFSTLRTLLDERVSIIELAGFPPFGLYWIGFHYQIGRFSTDFYQVR
ncbi:unnamed protein product [Rhizophagus irregularis]|nr:unnamed protein product [Rhizophagus irregularis]CAB5387425.1 unnamed protein product [Rhizophagus irregularis]